MAGVLDVFAPMIYWQDWSPQPDVPSEARAWVQQQIATAITQVGSASKFVPCESIASNTATSLHLPRWQWRTTQVNVLGTLGDQGVSKYDLFYYGDWLGADPDFLHPVDRAS
jgi:hypothetical protein